MVCVFKSTIYLEEENGMKKVLVLAIALVMMMSLLTACKEEFKCDSCNENVTSTKHEVEVMGEKLEVCDDCNEKLEATKDALEGLVG